MEKYLLGIDVGTTGTKAMVFSLSGEAIGTGYEEYICDYPRPNWVEQDAALLAAAVRRVVRQAVSDSGVQADSIISLAVSAQRDCVLFIDSENKPLKMISWLDNRAGKQVETIEKELGAEEFYRISGMPLSTAWILPKIMWVQDNEKDLWDKTVRVVQLHDFILYSLGADDYYNDEPDASFWGFFETNKISWQLDVAEKFGIGADKFPIVKQPGTMVGKISKEVANETGLSPETLLCVGAGDQNCAGTGAGVVRPGMASVSIGTGGLAIVFLDRPFRDPKRKGIISINAVHGNWQIEGLQNGSAGVLRWFRDQLALYDKEEAEKIGEDAYIRICRLVEESKPGADGLVFLPYLASANTPRYDPDARGTLIGLTFIHTRGDIARAVIEGITLDQKDILTSIKEAGIEIKRIRIMGGATKSDLWNQLQADCYGVPVETLKITDAAVIGAAICAGVGAGIYPDIPAATDALVRVDRTYEPTPEMVDFYNESYKLYLKTYESLSGKGGVFEMISERQSKGF
jgi:xylulokinase